MKISNWPEYKINEINAVKKILNSGKVNYWTGNENKKFENNFQNFFKIKKAIAVSNGTAGLYLAVKALNLKKNSEIIVTPRSYYASASCILLNNCVPKFVDISLENQNISIHDLNKKISNKTKAIICVHLNGYPCDMEEIMKIAKRKNIYVIEDCSQAHGAKIKNKFVGSFGDIGVWSFCQDKIMSTGGEGGMVATNSEKLFEKIWTLKDQGRNFKKIKKLKSNKFRYIHDYIGFNFRMTEMQAKIGNIQLSNLNKWVRKRNTNALLIMKFLSKYPKIFNKFSLKKEYTHSFYRLCVSLKVSKKKINFFLKQCQAKGLPISTGPCPEIYKEKLFKKQLGKNFHLKNANFLSGRTLSFLVDHTISNKKLSIYLKKIKPLISNL